MSKRKMMIFLTILLVGIIRLQAQNKVELEADFAKKAYESGVVEIELGKLAIRNGNSEAVRTYGKMMEEDHSKTNMEILSLTHMEMKFNLNMPEAEKQEKERLSNLQGRAFDQAYMSKMIKDHQKAIQLFETESKKNYANEIKDWLKSTLQHLREHLKKAEQISNNL